MQEKPGVNVLDYADYRRFLRDSIESRKRENPAFSYRYVAHRLGIDPGFFNRAVHGRRNLNPEHVRGIVEVLKLNARERGYFQLLVGYNQAKKHAERKHYHDQLRRYKDSGIKRVGEEQYALYSQWYTVVLRELLNVVPCYDLSEATCRRLARYLDPGVRTADIKQSIERLREVGLLVKGTSGRLRLADHLITTGPDIPPVVVQKVLRQFFDLGKEALERFERSRRVGATVTMSVSASGYEKIKLRLEQCRREVLEIAHANEGDLERVYHLNMQLFPVSKPYPGETE